MVDSTAQERTDPRVGDAIFCRLLFGMELVDDPCGVGAM